MIMRNIIKEIFIVKTPDGMGGITESIVNSKDIKCKCSTISQPEILNQYGQHGEEVLSVATFMPLNPEAYYVYGNKKFSIRKQTIKHRICYTILIEII